MIHFIVLFPYFWRALYNFICIKQ
uniref:Uncharacterized protein n=1 Tax=Anguilla anguilla TaxID=7936 RepID=A0A0E9QUS1_ANGAN